MRIKDFVLSPLALVTVLVSTFTCTLVGQDGMGSIAPPPSAGVPMLPTDGIPVDESDVFGFATGSCEPIIFYRGADLGIPAGGNIDAISYATRQDNAIPEVGPATGGLLVPGQDCDSRFSVAPSASGLPPGIVFTESTSDGAACDVFRVAPFGVIGNATQISDAECINPAPIQTDIDALTQNIAQTAVYPIFYSVDVPTAAMMGALTLVGTTMTFPVTAADILVTVAPGIPPLIYRRSIDMGLAADDDIDGLSMGTDPLRGDVEVILCTLRSGSTTASLVWPGIGMLGGAGVFTLSFFPGMPLPWATPNQMGLVATDEMNALVVGDPGPGCPPQLQIPYPGTQEDVVLQTLINGAGDPCQWNKTANQGDLLSISLFSPGGTFDGSVPVLAFQVFFPPAIPFVNFLPDIHLDINAIPEPMVLFDGRVAAGPFPQLLLPPGGINLHGPLPIGLAGYAIRLQGIVISPQATTFGYATTDAHVIDIP